MFLTTVDGVFLDYHARDASRLHAPPAAFLGRNVRDVLPPSVAEPLDAGVPRVQRVGRAGEGRIHARLGRRRTLLRGVHRPCDGDKILSIVRDITERKRADLEVDAQRRELAHLSRVAMLGELSGTLAHELSQPLTAVLSNAQAARHLLDREPPDLERCARCSTTSSGTTGAPARSSIASARCCGRSDIALQPVDVNEVAREVIDLAYGELTSRRITVKSASRRRCRSCWAIASSCSRWSSISC